MGEKLKKEKSLYVCTFLGSMKDQRFREGVEDLNSLWALTRLNKTVAEVS